MSLFIQTVNNTLSQDKNNQLAKQTPCFTTPQAKVGEFQAFLNKDICNPYDSNTCQTTPASQYKWDEISAVKTPICSVNNPLTCVTWVRNIQNGNTGSCNYENAKSCPRIGNIDPEWMGFIESDVSHSDDTKYNPMALCRYTDVSTRGDTGLKTVNMKMKIPDLVRFNYYFIDHPRYGDINNPIVNDVMADYCINGNNPDYYPNPVPETEPFDSPADPSVPPLFDKKTTNGINYNVCQKWYNNLQTTNDPHNINTYNNMVDAYCTKYPNHEACLCYSSTHPPYKGQYGEIYKKYQDSDIYTGKEYCWLKPCRTLTRSDERTFWDPGAWDDSSGCEPMKCSNVIIGADDSSISDEQVACRGPPRTVPKYMCFNDCNQTVQVPYNAKSTLLYDNHTDCMNSC